MPGEMKTQKEYFNLAMVISTLSGIPFIFDIE
jgi:hypothetical protein